MKIPKHNFYASSRRCDCPANQAGTCMLPMRVDVREPDTGGWRVGVGQDFAEALKDALKHGQWSGYQLTINE